MDSIKNGKLRKPVESVIPVTYDCLRNGELKRPYEFLSRLPPSEEKITPSKQGKGSPRATLNYRLGLILVGIILGVLLVLYLAPLVYGGVQVPERKHFILKGPGWKFWQKPVKELRVQAKVINKGPAPTRG